jgi:FtsH-binding integral membrane protein
MSSAAWMIQFLSTVAGCLTATILAGSMPAVISAVCAIAYLLLLISGNILFIDGSMGSIGNGIFAVLSGAIVPIILQLFGKKGGRSRKRR